MRNSLAVATVVGAVLLALFSLRKCGRPDAAVLGAGPDSAAGAAPTSPGDQGFLSSVFSRPAVNYAPVTMPAAPVPGQDAAGAALGSSTGRELPVGGGRVNLGDGPDPARGAASAPPPAMPASAGPSWQTPSGSAGSAPVAQTAVVAGTPSNEPPPTATPAVTSPTLQRLQRRVNRRDRTAVNLGSPDAAASAVPTPAASIDPGAAATAATAATAPAADPGAAALPAPADSSSSGGVAADAPADPSAAPAADAGAAPAPADPAAAPATEPVAEVAAQVGTPQIADGAGGMVVTPSGVLYAPKKGAGQTVQPLIVTVGSAKAVQFVSAFRVDANGAGGWSAKDKYGHPTTTLKYSKTESLDPGLIPYIAIPKGFTKAFPGVKLGDYAAVSYGGKTAYAIVGDVGLPGVIGAGSIALASGLGIDPTPRTGGVAGGVTFVILAGSRDPKPARDAAAIQAQGQQLFARAGIPIQ